MYRLHQINHDAYYSEGPGLNINAVESSFGRFRRMEWGTYHRMSPDTANGYVAENFWREEHRHVGAGERLFGFLCCTIRTGPCVELKKYGTSQRVTEQVPRKIVLRPIPPARREAVDRLCALGLLPELLVDRAAAARDQLREIESGALAAANKQLQELTLQIQRLREMNAPGAPA
jgi:hypothetical protein